jgi:hypothetical protein
MILDPNGLADIDPDQPARRREFWCDETRRPALSAWCRRRGPAGGTVQDEFIRGLPFLCSSRRSRSTATSPGLTAPLQFLRQPGTLGVTIAPPTPIGLGELADLIQRAPNQILELLGVTITPVPPAAPN